MGKLIVMQFVSLDGVIEDPDGSGGTPQGGWAFRHGPEAVAGDKFALGPVLDTGLMLLGRRTWQLFSRIWPSRTDEFSQRMNAIPKLVASRSLTDAGAWANSTLLRGDLAEEVAERKRSQDVVVTGSAGVVDALAAHDLIDEYRLMVFPVVLGQGRRLFDRPERLTLVSAERVGQAVRLVYGRDTTA
ncbi:dihydrofolate reductase family protein [Nonomuraea spiralis]|uniref:Dihydrofolate reductase family protein n=1 Tax=Nonomuraea spiralis TaxID=46182 RepID=A0ABV5IKG3_9ACTN|nr:dihydrofolate reductase family protein [Nonomuraea spiralis]GGT02246.1 riboflavin biosynthesis protein RibD [Nonomuraea spiralis]